MVKIPAKSNDQSVDDFYSQVIHTKVGAAGIGQKSFLLGGRFNGSVASRNDTKKQSRGWCISGRVVVAYLINI